MGSPDLQPNRTIGLARQSYSNRAERCLNTSLRVVNMRRFVTGFLVAVAVEGSCLVFCVMPFRNV